MFTAINLEYVSHAVTKSNSGVGRVLDEESEAGHSPDFNSFVSTTLDQNLESRPLTAGILRPLTPPKASACNYIDASGPLGSINFRH